MATITIASAVSAARNAAVAATKSYRIAHGRSALGGASACLHPRGEVGPCLVRQLHRTTPRDVDDGSSSVDVSSEDDAANVATVAAGLSASAAAQSASQPSNAGPSTPRIASTSRKPAESNRKTTTPPPGAASSTSSAQRTPQQASHANLSDDDLLKARSIAQGQGQQQRDSSAGPSSDSAERVWAPQSGPVGAEGQPVGQFQKPKPQVVQGEFTSRKEGSGEKADSAAAAGSRDSSASSDRQSFSPDDYQVSAAEPLEAPVLRPPRVEHPFNTREFVQRLQEGGWSARPPASPPSSGTLASADDREVQLQPARKHDPAEALMEATRFLLRSRGDRVLQSMLTKSDLENEAYLFTAALSELRTELSVRARNDGAALRSLMTLLQREVDSLQQRMSEDIASLKHDIQVDMNNRKNEAKEEQNLVDQEIQDLNNRFTISLSDLKTEIEQNIKWDATRRALALVFGVAAIVAATLAAADHLTRDLEEKKGKKDEELTDEAKAAALSDAPVSVRARTAEELGLVPKYDLDAGENLRAV